MNYMLLIYERAADFAALSEFALDATEFFRIPVNRVVELEGQVEIRPARYRQGAG